MKNKSKIFLISLVLVLALCVVQVPSFASKQAPQKVQKEISALTKEPVSKKKIAFKFIMAMLGVATSSVIIYVGLSIYNKLFHSHSADVVGLNKLRTPENFKESFEVFLEKTNWD